MTKRDLKLLDRQLREAAKQERRSEGVEFSPLLHERVMGALRREGLAATSLQPERGRWMWRIVVPLGVAAAVGVVVWLLQPGPVRPREVVDIPIKAPVAPIPEAPRLTATQDVGIAANDALERGKFAYLDRDAQKLFLFVANQLPSLPQQKP